MSFVLDNLAERLGGSNFATAAKEFKFAKIKRLKAEVAGQNPAVPIIDMGIGESDSPAFAEIVDVLVREAGKKENRCYTDNGIAEFQEAAVQYLATVYGVKGLNPSENVLHGIGCKSILAMLPMCYINPGDVTLYTTPGYPIISTYTHYMGGEVVDLPLVKENSFYPDFSRIPPAVLQQAKLLYLNYPNNPTGQIATREFYGQVVEFAARNKLLVVSDASYAALTYDSPPLSFLSVDGAREVGVELHSLSKAFNMTGWRLGFIAGHPQVVKAYGRVKENTDSGQFRAIQVAGAFALRHPELTVRNCEKFSRRMTLLVEALQRLGFAAEKPGGTFYCYVASPQGTQSGIDFPTAEAAAEYILRNAMISTVPWDEAGAYLRLSVTYDAAGPAEEQRITAELYSRLRALSLRF